MVRVIPIHSYNKAENIVRSMPVMFDERYDRITPKQFWSQRIYHAKGYPIAYLLICKPKSTLYDPIHFGRYVVKKLSEMTGLKFDWAAAVRKSGFVWIMIKARAIEAKNRQFRYLYIDKQTTRELKEVVNLYDGYSYRKLRSSLD